MSKGSMVNEEIAVILCFAICIAILVFTVMFKCTGGNNESITNNQTITGGNNESITNNQTITEQR